MSTTPASMNTPVIYCSKSFSYLANSAAVPFFIIGGYAVLHVGENYYRLRFHTFLAGDLYLLLLLLDKEDYLADAEDPLEEDLQTDLLIPVAWLLDYRIRRAHGVVVWFG